MVHGERRLHFHNYFYNAISIVVLIVIVVVASFIVIMTEMTVGYDAFKFDRRCRFCLLIILSHYPKVNRLLIKICDTLVWRRCNT